MGNGLTAIGGEYDSNLENLVLWWLQVQLPSTQEIARQRPSMVITTFSNLYLYLLGLSPSYAKRVVLGPIAFGRRHIKKKSLQRS